MQKKTLTKMLSVFMAFVFAFGVLGISVANSGIKADAATERTVVAQDTGWALYSDGELEITENITADEEGNFPWADNIAKISLISLFGEDVTEVADGAFSGIAVKTVFIPSTVTGISIDAFKDSKGKTSLETIYYDGNANQFDNLDFGDTAGIEINYEHVHTESAVCYTKAADCVAKTNGYEGSTYCTVCLALIEKGAEINYNDAHVWGAEEIIKHATCETNEDVYGKECEKCHAKTETKREAHVIDYHDYSVVAEKSKAACGTEGGTYLAKCSICGNTEYKELPAEHVYEYETKAATCTTDGSTTKTCKYCDTVNETTKTGSKTGHVNTYTETTYPTCTEPGITNTFCSDCGAKVSSKVLPAKGHEYDTDFTIENKPTCTETGLKVNYCKNTDENTGKKCGEYNADTATEILSHTNEFWTNPDDEVLDDSDSTSGETTEAKTYKNEDGTYEAVWKITTAPTCGEKGKRTLVCKTCGETITDANGNKITEVLPETGNHTAGDWEITLDPTCTADGYEIMCCTECKTQIGQQTIPATGHTYVWTYAYCTEGGGTATKKCSVCGDEVSYIVPASSTHTLEETVKAPTCTEKGYTIQKCTVEGCGYESAAYNEVAALGHEMGDWEITVEPTCTNSGTKVRKCTHEGCDRCETEAIAPTGHTYKHVTIAATCSKEGSSYDECTVCGYRINEETIAMTPHTLTTTVIEPTCETDGYTQEKCSVCGKEYKENIKDKLGHDLDDGTTVAPTCTEDGYVLYKCQRTDCTYSEKEATGKKATGHTPVTDAAVAPTCTEEGKTEGSHCSVCNAVITAQKPVAKLQHTLITDKAVAATCTETGLTEGTHCTVCGNTITKQEVVDATGHTLVTDKAVAATCTETGLTEGSHCSVCNKVITKQEVVEAKGHTVVTDKAVAATCTETGLKEGSHCSVCGTVIVKQEVVNATGHTVVTDAAVAPTCTGTGLTEGSHCSVCGTVLTKQEVVAAAGHNFKEISVKSAATAFKSGTKVYKCSTCGITTESTYSLTFFQKVAWVFNYALKYLTNLLASANNA